ncbi:MAG: glycosyltransferase family 2 protein [Hyphomicrobiaceae bacterium]|nr:glycosyltransferase family 2 protein [Hyphomicrobiaceae bacterium]
MAILEGFVLATICVGLALAARQLALASRVAVGGASSDRAPVPDFGADPTDWPTVTVLVPAHNEEQVMPGCLAAMAALEYPGDRHRILVIDDRSTDRTGAIADAFTGCDPRIAVLHRGQAARPGKSAAVAEATAITTSDVVVLFDADYLPPPGLLKELVAPFADPGVGATMGRVVPSNSDVNLLTRLLDLERRAGYGVDQTGRALWRLLPQFGGTVGGIRRAALESVGGWREGHLAEDTDLTFRLALGGWRIAFLGHACCYEEVPEDCVSRFRQVRRWAYGHNECLLSYWAAVLLSRRLRAMQKLDGALILLFYMFPACALLSTLAAILVLAYGSGPGLLPEAWPALEPLLAVAVLAPYAQIMTAAVIDRQQHVVRVLPLLFASSSLSLLASAAAVALLLRDRICGRSPGWDKTRRYRPA